MVVDCSFAAAGKSGRSSADHGFARGDECDPLYGFERLSVASGAKGLPADKHGPRLFLRLARYGVVRDPQRIAGNERERIGGPRGQPNRRVDRLSERENHRRGGISGYDAGKKVKGRKRHILTYTLGLLLVILIHGADVQDRDGAPAVLKAARFRFPWLRHIFADGGYAGD
jgi:hypothetical protein